MEDRKGHDKRYGMSSMKTDSLLKNEETSNMDVFLKATVEWFVHVFRNEKEFYGS